jgi:uncharacterized protein (UPF0335 family)/ribosome modulation factor
MADKEKAPAVGHNSELTEAEKRALFLRGIKDLEVLVEEKNEVMSDIRNQRKRIIGYGFDPFEIDYALKLRKQEDSEMIDRRRREAQIARFLNHPIGTQPDMFDEVDRTPSVDKAYQEGKIAGAQGETAKSPHSPGTEQDQSWLRGWQDGQADLASGFKKVETADGQPELEAA